MRHRKQQSNYSNLVRAAVVGTAFAAAAVLGTGTALAGTAPDRGSDTANVNDPDVVDIDDVVDVDYIEDLDLVDVDGVDAHDTIDGVGTTITGD